MNKFVLLRAFTRERGITPYQYLLTVRINKAKELLERGAQPIGSRHVQRLHRPEPLHQRLQALHRPDARSVPGDFP